MSLTSKLDVIIVIPTFRRASMLDQLLNSLLEWLPANISWHIVVGDNDPKQHDDIASLVKSKDTNKIDYLHIAKPGLAHARNGLSDYVNKTYPHATFYALLDDDSLISNAEWLPSLMDMASKTDADVVGGPVCGHFTDNAAPWVRSSLYFARRTQPDGICEALNGGCNILVRSEFMKNFRSPPFDLRYNFSGGEDKDFFMAAKLKGAVFAWTNKAIVYERYEPRRLTRKAIMERYYSMGRYDTSIERRYQGITYAIYRCFILSIRPPLMFVRHSKLGPRVLFWRMLQGYAYAAGALTSFRSTSGQFYKSN